MHQAVVAYCQALQFPQPLGPASEQQILAATLQCSFCSPVVMRFLPAASIAHMPSIFSGWCGDQVAFLHGSIQWQNAFLHAVDVMVAVHEPCRHTVHRRALGVQGGS